MTVHVQIDWQTTDDVPILILQKQQLDRLSVPYYVTSGNHETTWSESGVQDFANPEAIAALIEASDGEPHFIAKSFPVWSEGINLGFFAVQTD